MIQSAERGSSGVRGKNKIGMQEKIKNLINETLKNLEIEEINFSVEHPEDLKNGDYSTNVAMKVCGPISKVINNNKLGTWTVHGSNQNRNPKELAEKIVNEINTTPSAFSHSPLTGGEKPALAREGLGGFLSKVEVAGTGFINFYLSREFFTESVEEILKQKENFGKNKILDGKKVMVEYTQPNPFKPFHIGHLMSNAIGESISRIVEATGAKTIRANYQGDVGPHVAKAIYEILKSGFPDNNKSVSEQAHYIGECYVKGNDAYETNEVAKKEIDEINKKIYEHSDIKINEIYDIGRKITLEAFEEIYKTLGTKFDYYFFESEMAKIGEKIVAENTPKVFEKSDGAIVFHAEKYDPKLHTRVFINSQGLPTYEAKELGLTETKFSKENPDISIVTTAIEQAEYMKVVEKSLQILSPEIAKKMKHVTHGMMRLASGKMSSRKGNVVTGESLLNDSMEVIKEKIKDREFSEEEKNNIAHLVGVAALKYSILKSSLGGDIIYDFEKSISFEGDSGPYLQYTAVRANSILIKAVNDGPWGISLNDRPYEIPTEITELEKIIYKFPEVVLHAYLSLEPHHVATYLTELASAFNTFYGNTKILDKENKYISYHLNLVKAFYQTMQNGLWLLGIQIPEKM